MEIATIDAEQGAKRQLFDGLADVKQTEQLQV